MGAMFGLVYIMTLTVVFITFRYIPYRLILFYNLRNFLEKSIFFWTIFHALPVIIVTNFLAVN